MNATRIHIGLGVRDVERAVPFYTALLGVAPSKLRSDYAKFEGLDPPVNLSINASTLVEPHRGADHFGIDAVAPTTVAEIHERLRTAGVSTRTEDGVTCCYAVQDKVWAVDPDGHRWEVYHVLANADVHSRPTHAAESAAAPCCEPTCCK